MTRGVLLMNNQPMPRGGARPGTGPKPRPPETYRSVTFTTRCTPAEKLRYDALKDELDTEYNKHLAELKRQREEAKKRKGETK